MIDPQDMTRKFGALDQSVVGSHTEQEWLDLLVTWNFLCFYCGEVIRRGSNDPQHEATKDHMTPISRGGVDFIGNIVPACLRCNQLKSDKTVEEFRAERAWARREKSTGNTLSETKKNLPQDFSAIPKAPTVEIAAMWKRVVEDAAQRKTMDSPDDFAKRERRRAVLKAQADGIKRTRLEAAGQMAFVFGEGVGAELMETEHQAILVRKGLHIVNQLRRQSA